MGILMSHEREYQNGEGENEIGQVISWRAGLRKF
jgi:hypothetical protein